MSINHLFLMDGYGLYVWSAYCITFIVFGLNMLMAIKEKCRVKKILKNYFSKSKEHS